MGPPGLQRHPMQGFVTACQAALQQQENNEGH